jgi:hypothetical protein
MPCKDGAKGLLNDGSDPLVKQEKLFQPPVKDVNTVFEIGLAVRGSMAGAEGSGGSARIELDVGPIGEEPIQSDENEVGKDFLFDTALSLGVKVLDDEDALADLVKLLDAPSAMVDINEFLERIALRIEQRGSQAKHAVRDFVFEQS